MQTFYFIIGLLISTSIIAFVHYRIKNMVTKRDYFAAHAPKPPKWFKPRIPKKPLHPGYLHSKFGKHSGHEHLSIFLKHYDDENHCWLMPNEENERISGEPRYIDIKDDDFSIVPESLKKEVANHRIKIDKWLKNLQSWEKMEEQQTMVQWRYYYADLMLNKFD